MTNEQMTAAINAAVAAALANVAAPEANPVSNGKAKGKGPKAPPVPKSPLPLAAPDAEEMLMPAMVQARLNYANAANRNIRACAAFVDQMQAAYGADWYAVARLTADERKALSGNEAERCAAIIAQRKALRGAVIAAGHAEKGADMPWSRARALAKQRAGDTGGRHETQTPKAKACNALQRAFLIVHKAIDPDRADRQLVTAMEALETALKAVKINPEKLISDAGQ